MSTFDVNAFQNAQFTDANSTEYVPVPEGEFLAVVDKYDIRPLSTGSVVMDVTWKIDDATVAAETGMDNPTVRQTVWLDINESGSLEFAKGKNVGLGRLREALGQNLSGQAWSFGMILGQVAKVRVSHRPDTKTAPGTTIIRADVAAVTKA